MTNALKKYLKKTHSLELGHEHPRIISSLWARSCCDVWLYNLGDVMTDANAYELALLYQRTLNEIMLSTMDISIMAKCRDAFLEADKVLNAPRLKVIDGGKR